MSLGVDLVPKKVCSLGCVYCEVGKTTVLTTERKEYIPYDKVIGELEDYFVNNPEPDYITFSGSGEPTLNIRLGDILKFIKIRKPNIPVAVLTNGTLLNRKDVRTELMDADIVLPSLDTVNAETFKKINRPSSDLKIEDYIKGLINFADEFKGKIWLEIFILPGYNYKEDEFLALREVIKRIRPDSVQLNTLDRPGTVSELHFADAEKLKLVKEILGYAKTVVIAAAPKRKNILSYREDIESAIMGTIERRPCTLDDLSDILGLHINEINKYLAVLEADNRIETFDMKRGVFYRKKK
jgi:wyosine [tRNA(Phe)-imidazoG37] synthetase (radical SAM superfamily)